ncbi:protein JOKA2-like isoform X2 [Cornus florida]|uniref:protein JOKA2-like isoform X2 n=1 Tax=Cornus florida TaxID=4283 RepID=UPI0028977FEC|nr:protein JOKA2-like isoform X2 [Cornus florida]
MESTIVIKVKYGETLRRFTAHVDENEQLDLDMDGLREKVLSLFNFAPDVDLTLTYVDEDGDVVTLVDEEDLHDVMRQSLNPLRITVKLNSDKGGRSYARSSGSSTPMRSPRVQNPSPIFSTGVTEILRSLPDPVRKVLSKLPLDFTSKATPSAPMIAEIIEHYSKIGQSHLNSVSEFQVGSASSTHGEGSRRTTTEAPASKYPKAKMDEKATPEVLPNSKPEEPASKITENVNLAEVTNGIEASVSDIPASGPVNLNASPSGDSFLSGCAFVNDTVDDEDEIKKSGECHLIGKSVGSTSVNLTPVAPKVIAADNIKDMKKDMKKSSFGPPRLCNPDSQLITNLNAGMPLANDLAATCARVHPFKRSYYYKNSDDGLSCVVHRGVQCDGCGVHPIIGPRFKSKVKEDFDLCSICFAQMGNEADYTRIITRMDRPASHHHPWYPMQQPSVHPPIAPIVPQVLRRGCPMKSYQVKLDGRFIRDVNIMDGTVMAPLTPFTKIWRMRNNGNMVWAEGTQLLWIGGDKLSDTLSVEVEIPSDGLPVDNELDIAVNFTSPELPGRYISYWRMASPSGQKFGQRVWVLIQVDAAMKDTGNSIHGFNLNLPPDSNDMTSPEIIDSSVEPMEEGSILEADKSAIESVQPIGEEHTNKDPELNFPINDTLLVGDGVSNPFPAMAYSPVSYPMIDLSEVAPIMPPTMPPHEPSPVTNVPSSAQDTSSGNDVVEQTLLRELQEMGFKQVDLNKEILRRNEYDLEQSVDDLCSAVSEWDPILKELQDMGFSDKEMNKRLLKKNNGSIKRVVMDLVTGKMA